jgi:hypothetical protein
MKRFPECFSGYDDVTKRRLKKWYHENPFPPVELYEKEIFRSIIALT